MTLVVQTLPVHLPPGSRMITPKSLESNVSVGLLRFGVTIGVPEA